MSLNSVATSQRWPVHQDLSGIVLCGGRSARMGRAKALLPWGDKTLVAHMVELLGHVANQVIVVAGAGQELPELPAEVRIARDLREGQGPLAGLQAGLAMIDPQNIAFVTACDAPNLQPAFVERLVGLLGDHDAAVPFVAGFHCSLAAVYRARVLAAVNTLLATDQLRMSGLFDRIDTRLVSEAELREVDPGLASLDNLNRPADYLAALARAGLTAPADVIEALRLGN